MILFAHYMARLTLYNYQSLSWDPECSKALIVIGDEIPHPASYTDQDIFWKDQTQKLADMGVVVYGVQALNNKHATPFYSEISTRTGGKQYSHAPTSR